MNANDPRVAQAPRALPNHMAIAKTLARYGLHDTSLAGSPDALYERHLTFDNAVGLPAAGARERFEAFASAVRDILSYRWLHTKQVYEKENPKTGLLPVDGVPDRQIAGQ